MGQDGGSYFVLYFLIGQASALIKISMCYWSRRVRNSDVRRQRERERVVRIERCRDNLRSLRFHSGYSGGNYEEKEVEFHGNCSMENTENARDFIVNPARICPKIFPHSSIYNVMLDSMQNYELRRRTILVLERFN